MPFVPVSGGVRVAVEETTNEGHTFVNTLGVWSPTTAVPTAADVASIADAVWHAWASWIMPKLNTRAALSRVVARAMDSITGAEATFALTPVAGTSTGGNESYAVGTVVQLHTATRARKARGRMFLGPITSTELDVDSPDVLTPASVATWLAAISGFLADIETGGAHPLPTDYVPAVLSTRAVSDAGVGVAFPITNATVRQVVGIQRRRRMAG